MWVSLIRQAQITERNSLSSYCIRSRHCLKSIVGVLLVCLVSYLVLFGIEFNPVGLAGYPRANITPSS